MISYCMKQREFLGISSIHTKVLEFQAVELVIICIFIFVWPIASFWYHDIMISCISWYHDIQVIMISWYLNDSFLRCDFIGGIGGGHVINKDKNQKREKSKKRIFWNIFYFIKLKIFWILEWIVMGASGYNNKLSASKKKMLDW